MANEYIGRFAPSPSGRMHLGNVYAALMAWLFAKKANGTILLRIEDIDKSRCKEEYSLQLIADLAWLGLKFDGECIYQSKRKEHYTAAYNTLHEKGLLYPCFCTRADLHAASAPHEADGHSVYTGRCRALTAAQAAEKCKAQKYAVRCKAPDADYNFIDGVYGIKRQSPAKSMGDFIVKRADGEFAYQLAAAADDGASGVTHIVRGRDLLQSVCVQEFIKAELSYKRAEYTHIPLLLAQDKKRLSKREKSLDLGALRKTHTAPQLIGKIARACGIIADRGDISVQELLLEFEPSLLKPQDIIIPDNFAQHI